jgi:hypothetical protein
VLCVTYHRFHHLAAVLCSLVPTGNIMMVCKTLPVFLVYGLHQCCIASCCSCFTTAMSLGALHTVLPLRLADPWFDLTLGLT